jgi:hypothetical protein
MDRMLLEYPEEERAGVAQILGNQLRSTVANAALDRKLRERLVAIATGTAPERPAQEAAAPVEPTDAESAEPVAEPPSKA